MSLSFFPGFNSQRNWIVPLSQMQLHLQKFAASQKSSGKSEDKVQWGSEYQPFEYRKHLNTELFEVRISNGRFIGYACLCYAPVSLAR